MSTRKITRTSTATKEFKDKSSEIRTSGILVQKKVGGAIRQHFESEDWSGPKPVVTRIKLPDAPAPK